VKKLRERFFSLEEYFERKEVRILGYIKT